MIGRLCSRGNLESKITVGIEIAFPSDAGNEGKSNISKQRGFSLIEQLTVVAVIVIVALWLWLILH